MVARRQKPDLDSMLLKLDYYLKQEEDLFAVSELSDLISATSSDFYFKDVSDKTISMFTEGGVAIGPLSYLLKAEGDLGRTYREDDTDSFTGLKDPRFLGLVERFDQVMQIQSGKSSLQMGTKKLGTFSIV